MKNMLVSLLAFFLNILSSGAQTTTLAGRIEGLPDSVTQIELTLDSYELLSTLQRKSLDLSSDGEFEVKLDLNAPTRAFISLGRVPIVEEFSIITADGRDSSLSVSTNDSRLIYFYLLPGDVQRIIVDANDIHNSLQLLGTGSNNSKYLNHSDWRFSAYRDKFLLNYYYNTNFLPHEFVAAIDQREAKRLSFLADFAKDFPLDDHLMQLSKRDIVNESVTAKLYYPSRRASYIKGASVTVPEDFYEFLEGVNYQDQTKHKGIAYFYFLDAYLKQIHQPHADQRTFYEFVREKLDGRLYYEFLAFKLGSDFKAELYKQFDKRNPYPDLVQVVRQKYKPLEGMLEGGKAPKLKLQAPDGKKIDLKSFKGKLIYIDLWATWCGPCIQEIPYLQQLENDYRDEHIVFLSLSMDTEKDYIKWKNFLVEYPLTGHQFWLDAENRDRISKSFNVTQIPRFILLDKKLRVIDANAPRPSSSEIRKLLDAKIKI